MNLSQIASRTDMDDERKGFPSASSWRRRELCAGSWQLEGEAERIGQSAHLESEDAASGTRIHAALAGEKVELSESEATTARFLEERAQEQVERIFQGQPFKTLRETRLWLTEPWRLSGQFDAVHYNNELALIVDFKTGFREPDPAEQNAQLKVLAVLVAIHLPTVKEVVIQLISGPFGVFEARFGVPELMVAYDDILSTLKAINAPDAPLVPGVAQCHYCPAINICQAVKDEIVRPMTKLQLSALPTGGERAAKLLDEVEILAGLLKEIKKFYAAKFEDPTYTIPGYQMVPGATVREVVDWDAARARLAEYLDVKELKSAADYRLGELEKALGKVLKLKAPQAKEKMNQILNGLVEIKQNAASLKRVKGEPRLANA